MFWLKTIRLKRSHLLGYTHKQGKLREDPRVGRNDVMDKRPGRQERFKMAARDVEFWPSLERNFSGIGCTLEA